MNVVHCGRCQRFIGPEEVRYIVGVHVTLDVDGIAGGMETACELVRCMSAEAKDTEAGLADLFSREMAFTVCSECRASFVTNPLGRAGQVRGADLGLLQ